MEKDSATGLDRAGVCWILLVSIFELRFHSDFSEMELLVKVVQKFAAGEFSSDAANLITLDKGGAKIMPIATASP